MSVQMICPTCKRKYILGIDGTVNGCDECWGIVRNPIDHTIVNDEINDELEDQLTDMEKS